MRFTRIKKDEFKKFFKQMKIEVDRNMEERKNSYLNIEVLSTIDDLNQYLNGNVTKEGLENTLKSLLNQLEKIEKSI
tara:strand:- start:176 stop:406 length:231 start_codon:yes stop_codon:yes gene_type:complete